MKTFIAIALLAASVTAQVKVTIPPESMYGIAPESTLTPSVYKSPGKFPTALQAYKDFKHLDAGVVRGLGLPFWARSLINDVNPFKPSGYSQSNRFLFVFNAPEFYIYNMECVVVQYTITWKCHITQEQTVSVPVDSLGTKYQSFTYEQDYGTVTYRDRVFSFYVKSVEGWMYHGTFSNLDGMRKLVEANSILPGYSPGFGRNQLDKPAWEFESQ